MGLTYIPFSTQNMSIFLSFLIGSDSLETRELAQNADILFSVETQFTNFTVPVSITPKGHEHID